MTKLFAVARRVRASRQPDECGCQRHVRTAVHNGEKELGAASSFLWHKSTELRLQSLMQQRKQNVYKQAQHRFLTLSVTLSSDFRVFRHSRESRNNT